MHSKETLSFPLLTSKSRSIKLPRSTLKLVLSDDMVFFVRMFVILIVNEIRFALCIVFD